MFSVYGIGGPIFRGTFEGLKDVAGIFRSTAVRPVAGEDQRAALSAPAAQAVSAYREMLRTDTDRGPLYHAYQIMQRQVVSVSSEDAVEHAWQVLLEQRIHQAPVLDPGYRLVGVVSERDLLTVLNVDAGRVRDVLARKVADVMSTPVVCAHPITDIRRIAHVLLEHQVDGVPIINETEALVGFVSRSDIVRAIVADPPLSLWR
ncbi:MAG TPA: CBS domain-containing protein [Plasticicumulans sp.]|nr:CBS domain-containing protein [Plasticicumulans sp.]